VPAEISRKYARFLAAKNKLSATDARSVEEAFRARVGASQLSQEWSSHSKPKCRRAVLTEVKVAARQLVWTKALWFCQYTDAFAPASM